MTNLSTTDKRTFFLTLSPHEGQDLACIAGFSPPSPDVAEIELTDIASTWVALSASGTLDVAKESALWMAEFLAKRNNLTEDEAKRYEIIFYGYSASLLGLLLDQDLIKLNGPELPTESLAQFASVLAQVIPILQDYMGDEDDDDDFYEEDELDGE